MTRRWTEYRALLGPVVVVLLFLAAMRWSPFEPHRPPVATAEDGGGALPALWTEADRAVFRDALLRALDAGADTLPMGEAVVAVGRLFEGAPYAAHTLEVEGPERVVVNLRGFDCVTFVEHALSLARLARLTRTDPELAAAVRALREGGGPAAAAPLEARYTRLVAELRYRDGTPAGYAARLHYFSEWIADNARRGLLADVTPELGGVPDREPVTFMTAHPEAYPQLSEPSVREAVRAVEARLSSRPRLVVPEDRIPEVEAAIHDGDIIAATSTVAGLDVAHTGIAVWEDGTLRLLHAPLAGGVVQVSTRSLAERIAALPGQDGIMVARPVDVTALPMGTDGGH